MRLESHLIPFEVLNLANYYSMFFAFKETYPDIICFSFEIWLSDRSVNKLYKVAKLPMKIIDAPQMYAILAIQSDFVATSDQRSI